MRKLYLFFSLLITTLFLQSCATIFYPQKSRIQVEDEKTTVYLNTKWTYDQLVTPDASFMVLKPERVVFTSFKKGYRPKTQFFRPNKFNFGVAVDLAYGALLTYSTGEPAFFSNMAIWGGVDFLLAGKRLPRRFKLDAVDEKLYQNTVPGLFIYPHEDMALVVCKNNYVQIFGKDRKFIKNLDGNDFAPGSSAQDWELYEWTDNLLANMKFQEPRPDFITPYARTIKLNATVNACVTEVYKTFLRQSVSFSFRLTDTFGNEILVMDQKGESQIFSASHNAMAMADAMYDALTKFFETEEFKKATTDFQKMYDEQNALSESITLAKPLISSPSFEEMVDAQVSIDMNDDTHGSGCLISPEGHILASHRIVGKADTVDVVFSNGVKKKARVIRRDAVSNVVLMKADTIGNAALLLEKEINTSVGEEVLAVGSPVSMSLAQTLTSGIISSMHKVNELDYFQTDVRISRGGNGSPLINKKGRLIGIVNEKYIETGVEGISFAVSSADILKRLKLTYSN